jgi:tRNA threonylcarbamoyladenosine biosynthesis protein TsaB
MRSDQTNSPGRLALAFETSSRLGSVALGRADEVLDVRIFSGPRKHAVEFLPAIDDLCRTHRIAPGEVAQVFVSSGPGSFTGLRIGVTAARMIALAVGADVVSVPTLDVIAQNALNVPSPPNHVAVLLDAKRGRVYAAAYELDGGAYRAMTEPVEADPLAFLSLQSTSCAVLGEGVLYHAHSVNASGRPTLDENLYPPRAETVYRLGRQRALAGSFTPPRELVPTYIRPPEAEEKWEAKRRAENR